MKLCRTRASDRINAAPHSPHLRNFRHQSWPTRIHDDSAIEQQRRQLSEDEKKERETRTLFVGSLSTQYAKKHGFLKVAPRLLRLLVSSIELCGNLSSSLSLSLSLARGGINRLCLSMFESISVNQYSMTAHVQFRLTRNMYVRGDLRSATCPLRGTSRGCAKR